jgi:hypothetical protein
MSLQFHVARRLRHSIIIAAAGAGALALASLAWAAPQEPDLGSFAAQSQVAAESGLASDKSEAADTTWVVRSGDAPRADHHAAGSDNWSGNGSWPAASDREDSFSRYGGKHHSDDGGGWVDHGDWHGHHDCDDGCGSTSAVPEPSRAGLMVAGIIALLILVRRRRGASRFATR